MTAVLLVTATLTAYAWRAVFDSGQFARRATSALQDPSVRDAAAARVTDELVRRHPNLLAARPAVAAAVSGTIGSDAFGRLFQQAVRDAHGGVFRRDQDTVTLTVLDVGVVVAEALRMLRPDAAAALGPRDSVALLDRDLGAFGGDLVRLERDVRGLAIILGLLALGAAAALLVLARDRRAAAARLGVAVAIGGVIIVVAKAVARVVVLDRLHAPDARAAASAVWDAYLGDLRLAGWLIAGTGVVLAAAARSVIRPIEIDEPLGRAWRAVSSE